jgi:tRNA uridine 5-carboxymethylaminomethyl modification enzyme
VDPEGRLSSLRSTPLGASAAEQVEIAAVYDGYLKRQEEEAQLAQKMEGMRIPPNLDFGQMKCLSFEAVEKLSRIRPETIGQASRIPGLRSTDIAYLIAWVKTSAKDVLRGLPTRRS